MAMRTCAPRPRRASPMASASGRSSNLSASSRVSSAPAAGVSDARISDQRPARLDFSRARTAASCRVVGRRATDSSARSALRSSENIRSGAKLSLLTRPAAAIRHSADRASRSETFARSATSSRYCAPAAPRASRTARCFVSSGTASSGGMTRARYQPKRPALVSSPRPGEPRQTRWPHPGSQSGGSVPPFDFPSPWDSCK